jgi:hypothetical protein
MHKLTSFENMYIGIQSDFNSKNLFIKSANSDQESFEVVLVDEEKDVQLMRQKRQFGFGGFPQQNYGQNYGQSSALANANANNFYQGPNGFGASNALAGAQSFQSQGPLGGFGASAANAGSQGFHAGPGGISGNAGFSGSQSYNLPGGKTVALAYGAGYK